MKSFKVFRNGTTVIVGALVAVLAASGVRALENAQLDSSAYELADSNSLYGSYLAGRLARNERDNSSAAEYYREAMEKDPDSKEILEETFQLRVATGKFSDAQDLAKRLVARDSQQKIANFFLGINAFSRKSYAEADKHFKNGGKGPIMDLTGNLARAWVEVARGHGAEALKLTMNTSSAQTEGAMHIELLHRAMIADIAKQRAVAKQAYAELLAKNPRTVRAIEAYARHLAFWGEKDQALQILQPHISGLNPNPLLKALAKEINDGKQLGLLITTPQDGLAEVFQGIGEALAGDQVLDAGQIYLQLSLHIRPDFVVAQYSLGELYDQLKNYQQAADLFARVPQSSPLWLGAQVRRAYDLNSLERLDEATALLKEVIKAVPDDMRPYYTLGTLLRANKKFAEALPYFSQTIERLGPVDKSQWSIYYARGVCYERAKDWSKAEADLKRALELDSNQELALNYLGYSWVDQSTNIKEGMELIRRAVQLRPNDGYFIDSLGWAHFRQREYEDAVKHLERAVELKPEDPVINDHLGDAFWKVGRKIEAQYQWKQSLDLKPEPEDAAKIKKKLETGVLEETSTRASLDTPTPAPATAPAQSAGQPLDQQPK